MIKEISVTNFGPFESTHTLKLKPETFIIGTNNIGKSTFVTAYDSVVRGNLFNSPLNPYRTALEAAFGQKRDSKITLTVTGEVSGTEVQKVIEIQPNNNQTSLWFNINGKRSNMAPQIQPFDAFLQNTWYLSSS